MRVLVTWGSKLGGTAGIARIIGETLSQEGFEVVLAPARQVRDLGEFDAAIIGGGLYANHWHRDAYRLVARNVAPLRRIPVWLFSSGPLDDSAEQHELPAPTQVAVLAKRIGAIEHVTFGGRLAPDAKGMVVHAMAKRLAGDWRNPDRIRAWSQSVARALPLVQPRAAMEPPGRGVGRVVSHAVVGWAACALVMLGLLRVTSTGTALVLHALAAPAIFTAISVHYFRLEGARDPLRVALAMVAIVAVLDAVVIAGAAGQGLVMFSSFVGMWLPLMLIVGVTWAIGFVMSTMPWPKQEPARGHDRPAAVHS